MRVVQITKKQAIEIITDNMDVHEDVLFVPIQFKGEVKSLLDMSVSELNSHHDSSGIFLFVDSRLNGIGNGKLVVENGLDGKWENYK